MSVEVMRQMIPFVEQQVVASTKEQLMDRVLNWIAYKEIFAMVYQVFVVDGELEPIEKLPKAEKERIWEMTKETREHGKEGRIRAAKAIYLIEYITG